MSTRTLFSNGNGAARRALVMCLAGVAFSLSACVATAKPTGVVVVAKARPAVIVHGHVHSRVCGHYYHGGMWFQVAFGHRHGPNCGHVWTAKGWGVSTKRVTVKRDAVINGSGGRTGSAVSSRRQTAPQSEARSLKARAAANWNTASSRNRTGRRRRASSSKAREGANCRSSRRRNPTARRRRESASRTGAEKP